jgi:hypothetical protein
MGFFMKEHDIYVGSVLEQFNLRFAPPIGGKEHYGGLEEMVELQKEFQIFKAGRSFRTSISILNIGGSMNHDTKNRWYKTLDLLRKLKSNVPGRSGDQAIVEAIIANLAAKKPLPVYFTSHDSSATPGKGQVIITEKGKPLYYMKQDYLIVSFPFATVAKPAPAQKKTIRKPKA